MHFTTSSPSRVHQEFLFLTRFAKFVSETTIPTVVSNRNFSILIKNKNYWWNSWWRSLRGEMNLVPPNITKFYITWFRDAQNHSFHVKFTWFHVNSFRDHVKFVIFVHFTWNSRDVISRDEALVLISLILISDSVRIQIL